MAKGEASPIKTPEAKAEIVSSILNNIDTMRSFEPVTKDDAETCRERIKIVFDYCKEYGRIPTVELLCLVLGRSRTTLWEWQRDEKCENGRIIEQAKATINALMTEMAITGAVNPVYVMFSQKCNYGYVEPRQEIALEVKPQNVAPMSREAIAAEFGNLLEENSSILLPPLPNTDIESEE